MPEKIILQDGTEREVPTEDEMKAFNENASKVENLNKQFSSLRDSLGLDAEGDINAKIQEMKDNGNPNWAAARQKMKNMESVIKENGWSIDDNGNVTKEKNLSEEDFNKKVQETVLSTLQQNEKTKLFSKFSEEHKGIIEPLFDKLMTMGGSMEENLSLAVQKAFPDNIPDPVKSIINTNGGVPNIDNNEGNKVDTVDTERGRALAKAMGLTLGDAEGKLPSDNK